MKPIKLYYQNIENNFGDVLSKKLVEKVSNRTVEFEVTKRADLVAVGSLGEVVVKKRLRHLLLRAKNLDVWGMGFLKSGKVSNTRFLNIYALRGEYSRERLKAPSTVALGDPGILTSRFYNYRDNTDSVVCIAHTNDLKSNLWISHIKRYYRNVKVIDVRDDSELIISEIARSRFVFTTAMHPLIVANSFLVPVIYIDTDYIHPGGSYKIKDYFSAFNVEYVAVDLSSLLDSDSGDFDMLAKKFYISEDRVRLVQDRLLDSFPQKYVSY